ncbi:MAG: hypothetical protein FWH57_08760 [Oscillospiraceae bacterium]|nr:hypothetical protein [Oscillospiraceae bacterium]
MARFCQSCGEQVGGATKFCVKCGAKLGQQLDVQPQVPQQPPRYEPPQSLQYESPQSPQYEPQQSAQNQQPTPPQYAPSHPYQQYPQDKPPALQKKKRRIPIVVLVLLGVVVFCAAIVGAILLFTKNIANQVNQDFISIGNDRVPSVKYILGENRAITGINSSIENGVSKKEIQYSVPENQQEDMTTYIIALREDYGYKHINDYDFSESVGVDIELAKESDEDGYIVTVRVDYNRVGYTITITREQGALRVIEDNLEVGSTPSTPDDTVITPETKAPEPTPTQTPPEVTTQLPLPTDSLLGQYLDTMTADSFYLSVHIRSGWGEQDDEEDSYAGLDLTCEIAKEGSMMAMVLEDFSMRVIYKDDKSYTVMPSVETVVVSDYASGFGIEDLIPETDGLSFLGTGTGEMLGRTLPYEAYHSDQDLGEETRLYSEDGVLVGLQQIVGGQVSVTMEIFELSVNVPPGIFDIPESYTVIEG